MLGKLWRKNVKGLVRRIISNWEEKRTVLNRLNYKRESRAKMVATPFIPLSKVNKNTKR